MPGVQQDRTLFRSDHWSLGGESLFSWLLGQTSYSRNLTYSGRWASCRISLGRALMHEQELMPVIRSSIVDKRVTFFSDIFDIEEWKPTIVVNREYAVSHTSTIKFLSLCRAMRRQWHSFPMRWRHLFVRYRHKCWKEYPKLD